MSMPETDNSEAQGGIVRMTRQRRVILDQMRTPGEHLTADEVYERVRRRLPSISLGTVYRNLEILSRVGRIRKLHLGGGRRLYDGGLHRHYHVRCVRCGRVADVSAEPMGNLDAAAGGLSDFEILDHELEFRGLCPACRGAAGRDDGPSAPGGGPSAEGSA